MDNRKATRPELPYGRAQLLLSQGNEGRIGASVTRRAFPIVASCALLAGCGDGALTSSLGSDAGATLDARAVETGVLPNPDKIEFAGRFETRSDLGIDKFCAVNTGANRFNIGFLAVFGPESKCEGTGTASVQGDKVEIALNGKGACTFAARYDGIELRFAGAVESGCARYCSERASLSGTHYFMIEPGDSAARNTLGREIERLCG